MKPIKILLDNGHGKTSRNQSPDGTIKEYLWTRDIVHRVKAKLKQLEYDVMLITPEEEDIYITERIRRVNVKCDVYGSKRCLLISVHNNALGYGEWNDANGFSTFVSKNASNASKIFADLVYKESVKRNLLGNRRPKADENGRVYWTWSWTPKDISILSRTRCPSVLTECMFMTNRHDVEYLDSEVGREEIADLHVAAIEEFVRLIEE